MFRKVTFALIVGIGLAVLLLWSVPQIARTKLALTTCLEQSGAVRPGAKVRMEGVDVGVVRSVSDQLGNKTCPANVALELRLPKDKHVPRDARTYLLAEGVLGPTYVEISTASASGTPIESGGVLQAIPTAEMTPQAAAKITDAIQKVFAGIQGPCFVPDNRCVIHIESPDFPALARQAQISGVVKVRATVGKEGAVTSAVAEGPKILKEAAAQNLAQWRFSPGDSRQIEIAYDFRLEGPEVAYEPKPNVAFDLPDRVTITSHAPVPIADGVTIKARKGSH